jgi:hypothetical protein
MCLTKFIINSLHFIHSQENGYSVYAFNFQNFSVLKLTSHIPVRRLLVRVVLEYGRTGCGLFLVWTPLFSDSSFWLCSITQDEALCKCRTCLIYITERKEGDAHCEVGNPTTLNCAAVGLLYCSEICWHTEKSGLSAFELICLFSRSCLYSLFEDNRPFH